LKALRKRELAFDIVFLDPPYARKQVEQVLHILDEDQLLSKGGIVVAESDVHTSLPQTVGDLQLIKGHKYGQTMLRMYQLKED
jgi:16S rRNA (guanine966-N2)-methyltransferase